MIRLRKRKSYHELSFATPLTRRSSDKEGKENPCVIRHPGLDPRHRGGLDLADDAVT